MTDRLSDLLHSEASALDVPPAPGADVVRRGRARRRRTRIRTSLAVAAVVVVVAGAVVGAGVLRDDDSGVVPDPAGAQDPTARTSQLTGAVFSVGPTVYLQDGVVDGDPVVADLTDATIDDVTVKSIYYTSAGVLVRHGLNNYSDGGGPQRFSLVTADGTVRPLDLETEETWHATDPDQPYVTYAQLIDGVNHVLVRDVRTDEQVADVTVPGDTSSFSPVSLDGDLVYLGDGETVHVIDWRTGEVSDSAVLQGNPEVANGRALVATRSATQVVDVTAGTTLRSFDLGQTQDGLLSPDGNYVAVSDFMAEQDPLEVYAVDTGTRVTVDVGGEWGWDEDGDIVSVSDSGDLTTCLPAEGRCETLGLDLPVLPNSTDDPFASSLALGGVLVES